MTLNFVVCVRQEILPVRCVYLHFCRRMPLHGKQQSTQPHLSANLRAPVHTHIYIYIYIYTRECIQVQKYARESKGLSSLSLNSRKK